MSQVNVVELTPGVSPTGDLINGAVAIKMMEPRVCIGEKRDGLTCVIYLRLKVELAEKMLS